MWITHSDISIKQDTDYNLGLKPPLFLKNAFSISSKLNAALYLDLFPLRKRGQGYFYVDRF